MLSVPCVNTGMPQGNFLSAFLGVTCHFHTAFPVSLSVRREAELEASEVLTPNLMIGCVSNSDA